MKKFTTVLSIVLATAGFLIAPVWADATPGASGGGWVPSNFPTSKAHFAFTAHIRSDGSFSGNVNFNDDVFKFRSDEITLVSIVGSVVTIQGFGTVNGLSGLLFTMEAVDNGEPGAGRDIFSIDVAGYTNSSVVLGGGNVQVD